MRFFVYVLTVFLLSPLAYAADVTQSQTEILRHDYPAAIDSARAGVSTAVGVDRAEWLYYTAEGLLLNRDFFDAIQIFRSILAQYPGSEYAPRAMIRSADAYYLLEKYSKALDIYRHFLTNYAGSKYVPQVCLKASYAAQKSGAYDEAKKYADMLQTKFPNAIETPLLRERSLTQVTHDYKVQAGVFANRRNAEIYARKLSASSFVPTISDEVSGGGRIFRVFCGTYADPDLADRLVRELKQKGYSAKRIP